LALFERSYSRLEHYLQQPNNSQPPKMPKRKRDDGTEGTPEKSPEPVADPKQKRLQLKLHQATVKLGHAFKVAKGFERQKLGRRQKTAAAAKNEKDAQRVETEIAALKVRGRKGRTNLYNGKKLTEFG
jgi:hypothetical protein